mmetsp:Transcript_1993/g.6358  ORF Transcript_1993/g.6358 Transcript_1993/m.6358 type:complete len:298 (+) Transcript_1993:52-945(+)
MAAMDPPAEETVVKVSAGGTEFQTTLKTLRLIDFVHAKWNFERQARCEGEGSVFVDVDPEVFAAVLELARGKGPPYLQSLPVSLQVRVRQQMQEWHMDSVPGFGGFHFELTKSPFAVVREAKDTPGRRTLLSRGFPSQWCTVLGSREIPDTGESYFEVEVLALGTDVRFSLGVAERAVTQDDHFWHGENQAIFAAGIFVFERGSSQGVRRCFSQDSPSQVDFTGVFPEVVVGSRLGVFVDMDVGQIAFYMDGKLRAIHGARPIGKKLLPVVGVCQDTVLKLHAGLEPPSTEDSFVLA